MEEYTPVNLHYIEFSNEETNQTLNPVIFLHGLMFSKYPWGEIPEVVAHLSKRKVYTYDARNHGRSEFTEESNFNYNVQDLFTFMDDLSIQKAVLVGTCMGGKTAIHAALSRPDRVEMIFSLDMFVKKIPQELVAHLTALMKTWNEIVRGLPIAVLQDESAVMGATVEGVYRLMEQNIQNDSEKKSLLNSTLVFSERPEGGLEPGFDSVALLTALERYDMEAVEASGLFEGPAFFFCAVGSVYNVISDEENIRVHFPRCLLITFDRPSHYIHLDFPIEVCGVLATELLATELLTTR